nr:Outer membrane protein [uncultured bacterium]
MKRTGRGTAGWAVAVGIPALVAACILDPDPFTQEEFESKAQADRQAMFAGQEPVTRPLTLADAIARVLKYNLDRRSKMMEESLSLGQISLDRFDLLPKVSGTGGYTGKSEFGATKSTDAYTHVLSTSNPTYSTDRDLYKTDLSATWNILDFGASWYTAHQSGDRSLIASERRRKTVATLTQEVRFSFWRAAAAQILGDKVKATIAEAERALADAERVESENLRDPAETLRTQKTLLENIRQLETVEQELATARAELAALINVPPGSVFRLDVSHDAAMRVPVVDLPIERMEELALSNNPDLREQDYNSRIAADETRKEIIKLLPGINLSLSKQYDSNSFLIEQDWYEYGTKISWNLLNIISAPYRIDHAGTAEDVAEAKRVALRMAVLAQVHVINHQVRAAGKQFERADRLWEVERRLLQVSENQQGGGTQSEIERISISTSAISAELRRFQTYAQLQSSYGKLQTTLGIDPVPQEVASGDLDTLASGIAVRLDALPKAEPPAAPVQEASSRTVDGAKAVTSAEEPAKTDVRQSEPQAPSPALAGNTETAAPEFGETFGASARDWFSAAGEKVGHFLALAMKTEETALSAEPAANTADAAAPAPSPSTSLVEEAASPPQDHLAMEPAGASGTYMVQVGTYKRPESMKAVKSKLGRIGMVSEERAVEVDGVPMYALRVGPFASKNEARSAIDSIDSDLRLKSQLLRAHQ